MDIDIRKATEDDLTPAATLIATCQSDPTSHVIYLGLDEASIRSDLADLPQWTNAAAVATVDDVIVGVLIAEIDLEMGRLWWFGPFISPDLDAETQWAQVADRLHAEVTSMLPTDIVEQEACPDDRSDRIRDWCGRHRLEGETASVLLRREPGLTQPDARVRPRRPSDDERIVSLHQATFAGSHLTSAALARSEAPCLVIEEGDTNGAVVGYVVYEIQSDGSGYIDFVAVDPGHRGRGYGAALVETACADLFDREVDYAHLTVRENNKPARALYAGLGFVEERLGRPFRLGFTVG